MKKLTFTITFLLLSMALWANGNPKSSTDSCRFDCTGILVSSPLVIFLLVLILLFWKLNKEDFKLGDALKENITIDVSQDNPAISEPKPQASSGLIQTQTIPTAINDQPPFVPKTIQPKSSSRIIAFISGLVSVGLACSISSFWLYWQLNKKGTLNLSDLVYVLLALGIGVVPYAVNKISTGK